MTEMAEMSKAFFWAKITVEREPEKEWEIMKRILLEMEQRKHTIVLLDAKIKIDDLARKASDLWKIPVPPSILSDQRLHYVNI